MEFFGMGAGEILLILFLALIIWGPHKIPEIARTLGKAMRTLKKASFDLSTTVTKELDIEEKDHPPKAKAKPAAGVSKKKADLQELKAQLQKLIEKEAFEEAARLRDQIKEIEK